MAWAAFAVTVPSAVWRVVMIAGLMPGTDALREYELGPDAAMAYLYVGVLSAVQLTAGFLVLGLARPWGERILGRRVPALPVVVAAVLGGLAAIAIFDIAMLSQLAAGARPHRGLVEGGALAVMVGCYAPLVVWGPLVLLAAVGYALRRRALLRA